MPFIGFDWRYRKLETDAMGNVHGEKNLFGQINTKDNRRQFSLGVAYTLPMLVVLQTEIYHDGNLRVQLMREDIPTVSYTHLTLTTIYSVKISVDAVSIKKKIKKIIGLGSIRHTLTNSLLSISSHISEHQ